VVTIDRIAYRLRLSSAVGVAEISYTAMGTGAG
jgi:hypothetical protein